MEKDYPPTGRIIFNFTRENGKTILEMIAEDVSSKDHAQAMELLMERMTELRIGRGVVIKANESNAERQLKNVFEKFGMDENKREKIMDMLKKRLAQMNDNGMCMCENCVAERKQRIKNDPSIN